MNNEDDKPLLQLGIINPSLYRKNESIANVTGYERSLMGFLNRFDGFFNRFVTLQPGAGGRKVLVDDEPPEGAPLRAPPLHGQRGAADLHRRLLPRHARMLQGCHAPSPKMERKKQLTSNEMIV